MSDYCGSGGCDALAKDVIENTDNIAVIKVEQIAQDVLIGENKERSETNEENIALLSGSIEVKAFLETSLNGVGVPLIANVITELTFVKSLATNEDILDYDPILNIFKFPLGITGLYTDLRFGQALTGADTVGLIQLYDINTLTVVAERNLVIPAGSLNHVENPSRLFNNTNASDNYRVRIVLNRNIQLVEVYNNYEHSLTNELFDSQVQLSDPTKTSPSGTAVTVADSLEEISNIVKVNEQKTGALITGTWVSDGSNIGKEIVKLGKHIIINARVSSITGNVDDLIFTLPIGFTPDQSIFNKIYSSDGNEYLVLISGTNVQLKEQIATPKSIYISLCYNTN